MSDGIYFIIGIIIQPLVAVPFSYYFHKRVNSEDNNEIKRYKEVIESYRRNIDTMNLNQDSLREEIESLKSKLKQAQSTQKLFDIN